MNRTFLAFGTLASIVGLALVISSSARTQLGVAKNYVQIQSSTPGTAQSGHSNISGTATAGQFVGGGGGLTGVNADLLNGLSSGAFLQAVPNPLQLSGTTPEGVIQVTQSGTANFSRGISSELTASSPGVNSIAVAGFVFSDGNDGIGVAGGHQGGGTGVVGQTSSGFGVQGIAASSGTGVYGLSSSGIGVQALTSGGPAIKAEAGDGHGLVSTVSTALAGFDGIQSTTPSSAGAGVRALATGASGIGVSGRSMSATGVGVFASNGGGGLAFSTDGNSFMGGNLEVAAGGRLSLGAGASPAFPLDFGDVVGNKISLFGSNPAAHYGFGFAGAQLQIFSDDLTSHVSFGYGGSGAFTERARFTSTATLAFLPSGLDEPTQITSPYDQSLEKDSDNDSNNEWTRVLTNSRLIEQFRIEADDEAAAKFDGLVTSNGIDYAEAFKVYDPTLEPGDLVINAGSNWEYIGRSMTPYDNSVIGVISTKPAFLAGLSFDAEDQIDPALTKRRDDARRKGDYALEKALTMQMKQKAEEAHRPVAFMGRVPVKVVGPVKVGDHLTSSHIPGVAMAMTQPGHSIGIALEASSGGQAKVMGMIQPRFYAGPVAQGGLASVPAIKEMADRVAKLETENKDLRAENADLRSRIERLESLVLRCR